MKSLYELMVQDLPVVFLSYGEPNADEHYGLLEDLKLPNLIRVSGVKGFDAAHKEASAQALRLCPSVPNFVTVDADNEVVSPWFWKLWLKDIEAKAKVPDITQAVVSFRAMNVVNCASYGNGGLKIWSHAFAQKMVTHEQTEGRVIDFCGDPNYVQMKNVASLTKPNGSPLQAFRAGYREGVKLITHHLGQDDVGLVQSGISGWASTRLHQWATIGGDQINGVWCMLGTMYGIHDAYDNRERATRILIDHDEIKPFFRQVLTSHRLDDSVHGMSPGMVTALNKVGEPLIANKRLRIGPFNATRSEIVRQMIWNGGSLDSPLERE